MCHVGTWRPSLMIRGGVVYLCENVGKKNNSVHGREKLLMLGGQEALLMD